MAEEHTTIHERADGSVDRTTVVSNGERTSSSSTWVWLLIALLVIGVGIYFATQMTGAEVAKDTAITDAAGEVGEAAQSVGDAAQDAADTLQQ